MLSQDRILKVARGHPELSHEALLLVRAERELAQIKVRERRLAILERKVLLIITVVSFAAMLTFAALAMIEGAAGGASSAALSSGWLLARRGTSREPR